MEKRQHTFLRDGRQALEGKLNLFKDAVGALRKGCRFVSKYVYTELARFTHPRFLHVFVYDRLVYTPLKATPKVEKLSRRFLSTAASEKFNYFSSMNDEMKRFLNQA